MNRILEFMPSQEEALVSRVLVLVHQAMDQHLPNAGLANRQFTKTLFADGGEQTAVSAAAAASLSLASDDAAHGPESPMITSVTRAMTSFGSNEVTSPNSPPADDEAATDAAGSPSPTQPLPPPPLRRKPDGTGAAAISERSKTASAKTGAQVGSPAGIPVTRPSSKAPPPSADSDEISKSSQTGQRRGSRVRGEGPDWVTRITLGLLLAGLMLLGYVLLTQ